MTQSDTAVTVQDWTTSDDAIAYPLDGTEYQHVIHGALATSTARWKGAEFIIETTLRDSSASTPAQALTQRTQTWSLDGEGVLTIRVEERAGTLRSGDTRRYQRR